MPGSTDFRSSLLNECEMPGHSGRDGYFGDNAAPMAGDRSLPGGGVNAGAGAAIAASKSTGRIFGVSAVDPARVVRPRLAGKGSDVRADMVPGGAVVAGRDAGINSAYAVEGG